MPDTQKSKSTFTVARYVVEIGSVIGLLYSTLLLMKPSRNDLVGMSALQELGAMLVLCAPLGYLLVVYLCSSSTTLVAAF